MGQEIPNIGNLRMIPSLCIFFHKWTKWGEPLRRDLIRVDPSNPKEEFFIGYNLEQARRCERCNKQQIRVERVRI